MAFSVFGIQFALLSRPIEAHYIRNIFRFLAIRFVYAVTQRHPFGV